MADLVLGVAKSLVEGTLTRAQSAIDEESRLRQSSQRDLVFIAGEFHMMQSFLSITTEENVRNNVVSTWVTQVRDLAYDVEDCIEFVVHLDTKSDWLHRMIPPCMRRTLPLDEAVDIIVQLKARVQDVSQRSMRYNLNSDSGPKPVMGTKQPSAEARDTAWKQQDLDALTKLITKKSHDLQVISVWVPGANLGSVSIIRKAYENPKSWGNFGCRAWVKLVHPFNLHKFISSLLYQFYANSREEQQGAILGIDVLRKKKVPAAKDYLLQEFMQHVNNQTYLIVLEGVSTMVEWDAIRKYLPDRKNGSRIVVSTQQFETASFCTGLPYYQQFSAEDSLCVLSKECPQIDGDNNDAIVMDDFPLIGRMSEFNELAEYPATARVNGLQVTSVWGVAGVGKSALVRNLYDKKWLQNNHFDKYGWVDVLHPFNLRDFCRSLLLQLHSCYPEANEAIYCDQRGIRDPLKECHNLLKAHRCLVVIDDLNSTEEWDTIQAALVSRPSLSVIIVITNEASIALHCADRKEQVFNVKGLEAGAAIDLFNKKVRRTNIYFPVKDHESDVEIRPLISKCGGLPKVIVAIADSFAHIYNWEERISTLNDQFMINLEAKPEFACLRDLFCQLHSYFRSCPDFLKPCIFYLSIFPKSQIIRRRRLVMRWVAEGYSKDKASESAVENGEKLFRKIIELSMIQPPEQTIVTKMRMVWCQVSAFFHEYIISRPKEENVAFALEVFALKGCCHQTTGRTGRHLVIEESWERDRIVFESIDFSRLRSLTVFGEWKSFFLSESMKVVRVLDLENASGVTDKDLQKMLTLLQRLKFLSLRGCSKISCLPSSVGDLRQLQILDVGYTSIVTMPSSITKLKKLQYIRAGSTFPPEDPSRPRTIVFKVSELRRCLRVVGVEVVSGVGELTALHTLGVVNVGAAGGKAILKELRNLTQLRKLGVSGVSKKNGKEFCSAISGHSHLVSLSVWFNKDNQYCLDCMSPETTSEASKPPKKLQSLKLYGPVENSPKWIKHLYHLRKLNLEIDILSEDDIKVLGGLPELCILRLGVKPVEDGKLNFCVMKDGVEDRCYKKMKVLEIASRSNLHLIIGAEAMENLELLKAACCSTGSQLQFAELKHLSKLKEVWVSGSHYDTVKKDLEDQTSKPVLKLKEVLSTQAPTTGGRDNESAAHFPFLPISQSSPAMHPSCQ